MPRLCERDLYDVPAVLREELHYHFVDSVDEVLRLALGEDIFVPPASA
jgi:ATP-dependent Lon protease